MIGGKCSVRSIFDGKHSIPWQTEAPQHASYILHMIQRQDGKIVASIVSHSCRELQHNMALLCLPWCRQYLVAYDNCFSNILSKCRPARGSINFELNSRIALILFERTKRRPENLILPLIKIIEDITSRNVAKASGCESGGAIGCEQGIQLFGNLVESRNPVIYKRT
jgi:hypothetical protein